jgi:hypothetical protein
VLGGDGSPVRDAAEEGVEGAEVELGVSEGLADLWPRPFRAVDVPA